VVKVGPYGWFPPDAHEIGESPNYLHVYSKGDHAMEFAGPRYENTEYTIPKNDGVGPPRHPNAPPYSHDIIIESDGGTVEKLIENHMKEIQKVLKTLE